LNITRCLGRESTPRPYGRLERRTAAPRVHTPVSVLSVCQVVVGGRVMTKNSQIFKAAVTGDTVGDPLKDTSGPALNIVMVRSIYCIIMYFYLASGPEPSLWPFLVSSFRYRRPAQGHLRTGPQLVMVRSIAGIITYLSSRLRTRPGHCHGRFLFLVLDLGDPLKKFPGPGLNIVMVRRM